MNPVIIIPARRASTRIPDKMLLDIKGKPLIRWTVEAALETGYRVWVATDDEEIGEAAGTQFLLTGPCLNGTERCIEAATQLIPTQVRRDELLINWQGDSPMTRAEWVKQLAEHMAASPCGVGTLKQHVDRQAHSGEVEVVQGYAEGTAVSFGRSASRSHIHYRHVGIYAIKPEAWQFYGRVPSQREIFTGLEQMRWVERGVAIATVTVPAGESIEINHDIDVGLFKTWLESTDETV